MTAGAFVSGVVIGVVFGGMCGFTIAIDMGRAEGRATTCEEWKGVIVEGACISRDSLREVKP